MSDSPNDSSPTRAERDAASAWESLLRAQVALMRRLSTDDIWDPVSMREYDVLFTLTRAAATGLRLGALNKEILLAQPSLSRLVDRLVGKGFLTKSAVPGDGRGTLISLTTAGREVQQRIGREHMARIGHYVGAALSTGELADLAALTDSLRLTQETIPEFSAPTRRPPRNEDLS